MRILIIGGTRFVGHAHGRGGPRRGPRRHPAPPERDRPSSPARPTCWPTATATCRVLDGLSCDATIDVCAYVPRQVRHLHDALRGPRRPPPLRLHGVGLPGAGVGPAPTRTRPLFAEPPEDADRGHQRDLRPAEGHLREHRHASCTATSGLAIIRPTYVVGPRDMTARYPWWPLRAARGGPMLAPGPAEAPMQCIDARDMGAWTVRLAEGRVTGTFTAARPAHDVRGAARRDARGRRQRRAAGPGGRRLAGRAGGGRAAAAAVDRGRSRVVAGDGRRARAEAAGLTHRPVRGGRPRHPRVGRGQPRPVDQRPVGHGARARAGAPRRLGRHPGMTRTRPPPRRHPADDLHHDVGAGDAHRRGQPRPGLPGRRRSRRRCSRRPTEAMRVGRQPVRPRARRRRPCVRRSRGTSSGTTASSSTPTARSW